MAEIDRIQRVAPAIQPVTTTEHATTSQWQGGAQHSAPEDKVELHLAEEEEPRTEEIDVEPEIDEDHGLDIAV